jgi:TrmH family RNA methyltransferase
VEIVLVRPETPANVGASARAMRNAGLTGLTLVSPGDWRTVECWRTAWGAHDVLEHARVAAALPEAVADCAYVVALSGKGRAGEVVLDVRDAAAQVKALAEGERAALVFGPETAGLREDEIAQCGRAARIPSDPAQPSLNLSHAVMVAAYEVHRAGLRARPGPRRATHGEKDDMLQLLREGLRAAGALPRERAEAYFEEWTALVQRVEMSPREVRILTHLARRLQRTMPRG